MTATENQTKSYDPEQAAWWRASNRGARRAAAARRSASGPVRCEFCGSIDCYPPEDH